MMTLRSRLMLLWSFTIVVCIALGMIVFEVYSIGTDAQIGRSRELARNACEAISMEFGQSTTFSGDAAVNPIDLMHAVLELILREAPGIEGGFWDRHNGFVAYAYPTHEGSGVKKDPPETEREPIAGLATQSLDRRIMLTKVLDGRRETIVQVACPIESAGIELAAWTMTRVPMASGPAYDRVWAGLVLLLGFVATTGAWLMWSLSRWSGQLRAIECALAEQPAEIPQPLAATTDTELNRIVRGVNDYIGRLEAEKARSVALTGSLATNERLASLGRMAAGIAHEIRNPLATMRLKVENALASGEWDQASALRLVLAQIERLEHLVKSLLLASKPVSLQMRDVDVRAWLDEHVGAIGGRAKAARVAIRVECDCGNAFFDPAHLGRALDNLLDNALAHVSAEGTIRVSITSDQDRLVLRVADDGPGVAPDVEPRLFEPFVSGRPDGTGLGLAIVREIARAHGGDARLVGSDTGAAFEIEFPWPRS